MEKAWLSIDFDDLRHLPNNQGHPTRSRGKIANDPSKLSAAFIQGLQGLQRWLGSFEGHVTFFIIADLFENKQFCQWWQDVSEEYGEKISVGNHGLSHKSWSAWAKDEQGFGEMLQTSKQILIDNCGDLYQPWFRAPAGYIAPWMAGVLSQSGFKLDSSINPSRLTRKKAGKGNSWNDIRSAMTAHGIIEREWKTRFGLPVNGPALFKMPLSIIAKSTWKKMPTQFAIKEDVELHPHIESYYFHVLDFARKSGSWTPPI